MTTERTGTTTTQRTTTQRTTTQRTTTRRAAVVAVAGLLITGAAALPSYAVGAGASGRPTCHGRSATLVGKPGRVLLGTPGDDVIISGGADVRAGRGHDLICVTGPAGSFHEIVAGAGDDVVDAATGGRDYDATYDLGPGRDTFRGASGTDLVDAAGEGRDRVETGAGEDHVIAGGTGGGRDHDVVDTGRGSDEVTVTGDPSTRVRGGAGVHDLLDLPVDDYGDRRHGWRYDASHGTVSRDGRPGLHFAGFESYAAGSEASPGAARSVRFVGSAGGEALSIVLDPVPHGVSVDMRGGDDTTTVAAYDGASLRDAFDLDGGRGVDGVVLLGGYGPYEGEAFTEDSPFGRVDVAAGRFWAGTCAEGCQRGVMPIRLGRLAGYDDVRAVYYRRAVLLGGPGPNVLDASSSCRVRLSGGAGDDVLLSETSRYDVRGCGDASADLSGGPGDDRLVGGDYDDALVGDAGSDRADGRRGEDTCSAESVVRCEDPAPARPPR